MSGEDSRKVFLEPSLVMTQGSFQALIDGARQVETIDLYFPREFFDIISESDSYRNIAPLRFFKDAVNFYKVPDINEIERQLRQLNEEGYISFYSISEDIDTLGQEWIDASESLDDVLSFYHEEPYYEELHRILLTELFFLFEESWFISRFDKAVEKFQEAQINTLRLTKSTLRQNFRRELDDFQLLYDEISSLNGASQMFLGFGIEISKIAFQEATNTSDPVMNIGTWLGNGGIRLIVYADP